MYYAAVHINSTLAIVVLMFIIYFLNVSIFKHNINELSYFCLFRRYLTPSESFSLHRYDTVKIASELLITFCCISQIEFPQTRIRIWQCIWLVIKNDLDEVWSCRRSNENHNSFEVNT